MSNEKPPMPDQPKTVPLEVPPAWAIAISEKLANGFTRIDAKVDDGFAEVDANIKLVTSSVKVIEGRVGNLEEARRLDEQRVNTHSIKVRDVSQNDLVQEAKISEETEARKRLEAKVDALAAKPDTAKLVLDKMEEAAKTPTGQKLVGGFVGILLLALSVIGLKLQTQVEKLQEKPATVQAAPTVYLPVAVPTLPDGGVK